MNPPLDRRPPDAGRVRAARRARRAALAALLAAVPVASGLPPAAAAQPDGRAYEMVSPADKGSAQAGALVSQSNDSFSSADGETIVYWTSEALGENAVRGLSFFQVARRTASGWASVPAIDGPAPSVRDLLVTWHMPRTPFPSADRSHLAFYSSNTYGPPHDPVEPVVDGSTLGVYRATAGGPLEWASRPTAEDPVPAPGRMQEGGNAYVLGGNADLSTLYFGMYVRRLTPEDEPRLQSGIETWGLYERRDGRLRSAAQLPGSAGVDPRGAVGIGAGPDRFGGQPSSTRTPSTWHNEVSADGRRLFFVSPDPSLLDGSSDPAGIDALRPQLYVRIDGERTVLASRDARTGAPAPRGIRPERLTFRDGYAGYGEDPWAYATPDGRHVVFQSADALTDGAPADDLEKAYRFDVDDERLTYLPGVSGKLLGISADGRRLLYQSRDDDFAARELRLWTGDGSVSLGRIAASDDVGAVRGNAAGDTWVFEARPALDPAAQQVAGTNQVYRYAIGDATPRCLSCPRDGAAPRGPAAMTVTPGNLGTPSVVAARGVTDDLSQVFFDSPDGLVLTDANGVRDAYRWRDGALALISSGSDPNPSYFLDNSADGSTVFFATAEPLDPRDSGEDYDVYAARAGGGFPLPPVPPPCLGDECQGPAAQPPSRGAPGSATFSGPADVASDASPPVAVLNVRALTAQQRRRWARSGRVTLIARVSQAGTVRAQVRARLGRRARVVAEASRTASRGGTVRLALALSRAARDRLRGTGTLTVDLAVGYSTSDDGPQRARVTLRRPARPGGAGRRRAVRTSGSATNERRAR